jgi:hypothetical protein
VYDHWDACACLDGRHGEYECILGYKFKGELTPLRVEGIIR